MVAERDYKIVCHFCRKELKGVPNTIMINNIRYNVCYGCMKFKKSTDSECVVL